MQLRSAVRDCRAITHNLELLLYYFQYIYRDVHSRRTTASVVSTHLYTRIVYVNCDRLTTFRLNGGGMVAIVIKSGRRDGGSVDSTAERVNEAMCGTSSRRGSMCGVSTIILYIIYVNIDKPCKYYIIT